MPFAKKPRSLIESFVDEDDLFHETVYSRSQFGVQRGFSWSVPNYVIDRLSTVFLGFVDNVKTQDWEGR
jgi:hypothetical protein